MALKWDIYTVFNSVTVSVVKLWRDLYSHMFTASSSLHVFSYPCLYGIAIVTEILDMPHGMMDDGR